VSGEVVGEYKVNNCESLCVIVDDFAPAPAAKDDDTPMPPTGSSNTQTTPRSLKRFRSATSSPLRSPSKAPRLTKEDPVTPAATGDGGNSLETVLED